MTGSAKPYVEFPVDRVVDVHWKKKPDEPPPDDGGLDQCGGIYNAYGGPQGAWIVGPSGLYSFHDWFATDIYHVPPSTPDWFVWSIQTKKFSVEIQPHIKYGYGEAASLPNPDPFPPCNEFTIKAGLTVIRDTDPHIVAQTLSTGGYNGDGPTIIEFDAIQPDEFWFPIVVVAVTETYTPLAHTGLCLAKSAVIQVPILFQAICEKMTYGGPPPISYTLTPPPPSDLDFAWAPPTGGWVGE